MNCNLHIINAFKNILSSQINGMTILFTLNFTLNYNPAVLFFLSTSTFTSSIFMK